MKHVMCVCVNNQVYLWPAEEQVSCPGHTPAAVPEGSRPHCGPQGGAYRLTGNSPTSSDENISNIPISFEKRTNLLEVVFHVC